MGKIGIIEIFFGSPWTNEGRRHLASFMGHHGFGFYLYGPKADQCLRKAWRDDWSPTYLADLRSLSAMFRASGVQFGVALSPFGFDMEACADLRQLEEKVDALRSVGIDKLGLFFDDMNYEPKALESQLVAVEIARGGGVEVLFCPTYYSDDPVLDKVFGQRPADYVSEIGRRVPLDVQILWTGPKVISEEISGAHLARVAETLRRKPFICDNFFANDGPRQCKFLKVKPLPGRSLDSLSSAAGWAFNPMNQSALSEVVVLAAQKGLEKGLAPPAALVDAVDELCKGRVAEILKDGPAWGLDRSLDLLSETDKEKIREALAGSADSTSQEILGWLRGDYTVGTECLTD
jgi:hyaluronoglucosaminidase